MITKLDQEIASILIITSEKQRLIEMLIDLLKAKQELIDQYEERFTELDAELMGVCPNCEEETTAEELEKWEMCHDCDRQDGEY